jgi:hypothetical protein
MKSGCIDPRFLDLGTSWKLVFIFAPRPLYHRGRATSILWIEGRMSTRVGVDDMEKLIIFTLPGLVGSRWTMARIERN